jgi:Domain of unknown function (DUF5134)
VSGSAAGGVVWIQTASALALLAVAVHCAARLVQASRAAARPEATRHAADLLMALSLAAMLWPLGNPIPPLAGEVTFSLVVAWSLVAALGVREVGRRVEWAPHVVGGAAMIYMFAGASGPLTWVLIACFVSFAAWSALSTARGLASGVGRVAAATGPAPTLPAVVLAPPVVSLCHLVMALSMVYLLLAMR